MKLSAVNLRTARLPEMVSFYRDLLGLPCQERVPGRWEIQVGDLCLALVQGEEAMAWAIDSVQKSGILKK